MKVWSIVLVLIVALVAISCNSGMEYIPISTMVVRINEEKTTFELKLNQEKDWDRVSRCVWTVDGKEGNARGRSDYLDTDRSTSHTFECS